MRAQAEVCPKCGTRESEWEADRDAYISDIIRCYGCELMEQEKDNIQAAIDEAGTSFSHGMKVVLRRNLPDVVITDPEAIFG